MAEDKGNEEEKFDFTSQGEELGYISLDHAILLSRQQAQEDGERYRRRLDWDEIVWSEVSSEQREDTFRIVLQFRRPGRGVREEQTGEEEFIFNQTGALAFRQVLAWPEGGEPQEELSPPISASPIDDEGVAQSPSDAASLEDPTRKDDDPIGDEDGDQEPRPEDVDLTSISFIGAIKLGFKRYFDFTGRSTRAEFWWWALFVSLASFVSIIVDSLTGAGVISVLFNLAVIIPGLAVAVRRLHDIDKSGWWLLLALLSSLIVPAVVLFFWFIRPSSD